MKRASTWAVLLLLGGGATSCRSLLETASFEDGDPSSGSTDATGTGTSTTSGSSTSGGGSTTTGGSTTSSSGQGTGGDAAGGGGTGGGSSSSSGGGGATGCPQNDDFGGPALGECWSVIPETGVSHEVTGDELVLTANGNAGWYGTDPGNLVYQEVEGDFAAAIRVAVGGNPGDYQMAGFVLRDGDSPPENWIKWEIGLIEDGVGGTLLRSTLGVTTTNGTSSSPLLPETMIPTPMEADLGICRLDGTVYLAIRLEEGWVDGALADPAPTLNGTLQLGVNVAAEGNAEGDDIPPPTNVSRFSGFRIDDREDAGYGSCVDAMIAIAPEVE